MMLVLKELRERPDNEALPEACRNKEVKTY